MSFSAYGQIQIKTPEYAMTKFEEFKKKEKFVEESASFYTGVADPKIRSVLAEKINKAADDFRAVAESGNPTDKKYQDMIEIGLSRFSDVKMDLDTEDRERVCGYFEELMDMVGLESSGGHLMMFMYGFSLPESS
ncbi:protein of unknown function [Pontibacter akesuensis]|uniref:DUF4844 domain-containing protein n=2 Tax=Pontibacter akesuensis TaxID=388950 RepID=A0A1I7KR50_9BACT|nr:protein of unknown function [Pontibacter akesuensis]